MGFKQGFLPEGVVGRRRRRAGHLDPAEFLEQIGSHAFRVEKFLELHGGELSNLLLGVVDATLLADAGADLLHDLLDVDRVGANVEIRHK